MLTGLTQGITGGLIHTTGGGGGAVELALLGHNAWDSTRATTWNVPSISGVTEGELLLFMCGGLERAPDMTNFIADGFTRIIRDYSTVQAGVTVYWKVADASDVARSTYAFNTTSTSAINVMQQRWVGFDPAQPIETPVTQDTGAGSTSAVSIAGITTAKDNSYPIAGINSGGSSIGMTWAFSNGWSKTHEHLGVNGGTARTTLAIATRPGAAAGLLPNATATPSQWAENAHFMFAIRRAIT